MKTKLAMAIFSATILLSFAHVAVGQNGAKPQTSTAITTPASEPTPAATLKLADKDSEILAAMSAQIAAMDKDLKVVERQAAEAERLMNAANAFIEKYNAVVAARSALIYRYAADSCACKTSEIELSADGKSIVRKTPQK